MSKLERAMEDQVADKKQAPDDGWEWAIVEVMGHRSHAGRIREEERFGAKMLRIDAPTEGDPSNGWVTHLYAAGAIFSLRYSDEETVMRANKPRVSPYRLTMRAAAETEGNDSTFDQEGDSDDPAMDELSGYTD